MPLAAVHDPAAVPLTLAAALGLHGIRGDVLAGCAAFLAERSALLVLDNCEHLLDTVRDAVALPTWRRPWRWVSGCSMPSPTAT